MVTPAADYQGVSRFDAKKIDFFVTGGVFVFYVSALACGIAKRGEIIGLAAATTIAKIEGD